MDNISETTSIILFDGICNLCNGAVNFILRRDPQKHFRFAPLQSSIGQALLKEHHICAGQLDTLILIEEGKAYSRSTAALRVARRLNKPWPLLYAFRFIPTSIRDKVYDVVARHRYRWFGKRETCVVPAADVKDRFLF